jgi:hypothetical protein
MDNFTAETAVIALQLQQMLMEFTYELDVNVGKNVTAHYTEDGVFVLGPNTIKGRAEIRKFYDARDVRVARESKDGVRTARHTFTNLRYDIKDNTNATLYFISIFYAGEGNPPVPGLGGPSTVADCRMLCRREADGIWRVAEFAATPVFMGNDPFFAKAVSKA